MKKINKWIIGVVATIIVVVVVVFAAQKVKLYLKGESYPFNAIIISGENQSISKAKDAYKDNTKYTKDYKYKLVTKDNPPVVVDGETVIVTDKYLIMTKETAKAMLKDQLFRIRKSDENNGKIDTNLLTDIPNIDDKQSIILGGTKTMQKLNIKGVDISLKYGNYSWIGYYPQEKGTIIITDNDTYKIIGGLETNVCLIRFKKGTMDCKSEKDKAKVNNKLSEVKKIDINYAIVEN
ncbi:MAG: lipoprotein BA_5634 family protein [Clostridium sp.]|uniref:lipoprotein BA_5634 family protein n=1 Tax=Clostridium sp. TaxID=1506 RepID=UPI003D6C8D90